MSLKKPNILFIMADQMAGPALPCYGHPLVKAPHLTRLANEGVVFESAYCNSPLCAPSRFSLHVRPTAVTHRRVRQCGGVRRRYPYLRSLPARPRLSHRSLRQDALRRPGSIARLRGAADHRHLSLRLRLDARLGTPRRTPLVVSQHAQRGAGRGCETTNQLDFDEEVAFHAVRKIYDFARDGDAQPFFLLVSFTHPHDPYAIPREYWDRYDHAEIAPPSVPPSLTINSTRTASASGACARWTNMP